MGWITLVTKILIPLLGAVVAYVLIPYIKERTTAEQRSAVAYWVQVAVHAAEMIYTDKGQGRLKKEYVLEFLQAKGLGITAAELDALIEAAVKELNLIQQ